MTTDTASTERISRVLATNDYPRRLLTAIPQFGLVAVLAFGRQVDVALAVILALDLIIVFAPWRVPRATRSNWSYWTETALYMAPLGLATGVAFATSPVWLVSAPLPLPILLGALFGVYAVDASRVPLKAVLSGDIAALQGGAQPSHCLARGVQILLVPLLEEVAFRGELGLGQPTWIMALASVVFVLRHYLVRGLPGVKADRTLALRIAFTVAVATLTGISGSIWPAVVAHLISNLPTGIVELQRSRRGFVNAR